MKQPINRPSKEELQRLYLQDKKSTREIAKLYEVNKSTIRRWIRKDKIPIRGPSESIRLSLGDKRPPKEELERLYLDKKKSCLKIAKLYEVDPTTVCAWLREDKILIRDPSEALRLAHGKERPSKEGLERLYIAERNSIQKIAKLYEVGNTTINRWLREDKILIRDFSDSSRLAHGKERPSKDELEELYTRDKKPTTEIAEIYKVAVATIRRWLREDKIPIRSLSEATRLRFGDKRPSKEELERLYIAERNSTTEIAKLYEVNSETTSNWLKSYGIPLRGRSEAIRLAHGKERPSKDELEELYARGKKPTTEIAKLYEVIPSTVLCWLKEYSISIRGSRGKVIKTLEQFSAFIKKDEKARNLAASALALNGSGGLVEQTLLELYSDKFKDKRELHKLVEESKEEIKTLVRNGITSLGPYLGAFSLEDRSIVPIILGNALNAIPIEKATPSLEERFTYLVRGSYGPSFNENPDETMNQLERKIEQSEGFAKTVYQRTLQHYQDTLALREEFN